MLLHEALAARAASHPTATAISIGVSDSLSYGDWYRVACRIAGALSIQGVQREDRLIVYLNDASWRHLATTTVALEMLACVSLPVRAPWPSGELAAMIADFGISGVLGLDEEQCSTTDVPFIDVIALEQASESAALESWTLGIDPSGIGLMLLTSGTTGPAKAVATTFGSLYSGREWRPIDTGRRPVALSTSTVGTSVSHEWMVSSVFQGVHVVLDQPFDPNGWPTLIEKYRPSVVSLVPLALELVADVISATNNAADMSCIECVVTASAPPTERTVRKAARAFPFAELLNNYGLTEGMVGLTGVLREDRPPTLGALGSDARLLDESGNDVQPGAVGQIFLRHDWQTRRYIEPGVGVGALGRSARAEDLTSSEGWLATGDLAKLTDAGEVQYEGRADDVILVAGHLKMLPSTVERAIETFAGIEDSCVFSVTHETLGDLLVAALVGSTEVDIAKLRVHLRGSLDPRFVPARIFEVDHLPRRRAGKLDRLALRKLYKELAHTSVSSVSTYEDLEEIVLDAFRVTLERPTIELWQDYFDEGGDSLAAITLSVEIERRTGIPVALSDVYIYSTATTLARHLFGLQ
jgi:acyl-coenzyme A synthetase/AMP-(fatty) acid ligase/acyl carrier protein